MNEKMFENKDSCKLRQQFYNTIVIEKNKLIETYIKHELAKCVASEANGSWRIDLFPGHRVNQEIHVRPLFIQGDTYYNDPDDHLCAIPLVAFFEPDEEFQIPDIFECMMESGNGYINGVEYMKSNLLSRLLCLVDCENQEGIVCHTYKVKYI